MEWNHIYAKLGHLGRSMHILLFHVGWVLVLVGRLLLLGIALLLRGQMVLGASLRILLGSVCLSTVRSMVRMSH